jgi:hypothetical protein
MKVRVTVTDGDGRTYEGEATLAPAGARRSRPAPRSPKPAPAGRPAPDFSLPVRAFVKRHAKGIGGPQKFTMLLARLSGGKTGVAVSLKEIEKAWNRMTGLMGGKFHPMYVVRAKENGWADAAKTGHYALLSGWAAALGK